VVFLFLPVLFLVACLVTVGQQDVALNAVVEDELVDEVFSLEAAIFPRKLGKVGRRVRVV